MAYENRNAAYDLSLFDDELTYSSAAPKRKHDDEPVKRSRKKQTRCYFRSKRGNPSFKNGC